MHTSAYWLTVRREVLATLEANSEEKRDGVIGLANTLKTVAMLFLMCDRSDIGVAIGDNSQGFASVEKGFKRPAGATPHPEATAEMGPAYEPHIFLYDNYPGGIGFSEPLFRLHAKLLQEGKGLIESCPCQDGCPSCVGPVGEVGVKGKEVALAILERIVTVLTINWPLTDFDRCAPGTNWNGTSNHVPPQTLQDGPRPGLPRPRASRSTVWSVSSWDR